MHREQRGPSTQRSLSKSNFRDVKWNGIESGEGETGRGEKKLLVTFSVCPWWLEDRDHFLENVRARREKKEERKEEKEGEEGRGEKGGITRKK